MLAYVNVHMHLVFDFCDGVWIKLLLSEVHLGNPLPANAPVSPFIQGRSKQK